MVPRPDREDYKRLKEQITAKGLDPSQPIVVNEDLILLDGHTRLQVARELGLEWVWVVTKDFEDRPAEKEFIILSNLARRHLSTIQRADLGLKLLEIEQERARERRRLAGHLHKDNLKKGQELGEVSNNSRHRQNFAYAGESGKKEQGKAMEIVARKVGISHETLRKAKKIQEMVKTKEELNEIWYEWRRNGGTSINSAIEKLREQVRRDKEAKANRKPPWVIEMIPQEELMYWLYQVADCQKVPRKAIDGAVEMHPDLLWYWKWVLQDKSTRSLLPKTVWSIILQWVEKWRNKQRAERLEEMPVPSNQEKIGPWNLDFVHQGELKDLVEQFPENTAHLIYSDVVADLEQVELLGRLAARALTAGKCLGIYVGKRYLPEAMARLSALGLKYFWSCAVLRPDDQIEVENFRIREKWKLLLLYRKGETAQTGWDWFEDGVLSRRPINRNTPRQLIMGLTIPGQLVVDPVVGQGVTAKVAQSLDRRYLCFGTNESDVRAINLRIKNVGIAQETRNSTD